MAGILDPWELMSKRPLIALLLTLAFTFGCSQQRHFALGARLEKAGRYDDALASYQAALQQTGRDDHSQESQIYYGMGECLIHLNRMAEAYASYEKSVMADFSNAKAHTRLGEFLVSAGAADRAREEAEIAMRLSGRDSESIALYASALQATGEKDRAKEAYREALALDPSHTSVAVALADIYNQEDDTKNARAVLEDSAKSNPNAALPLLALARLHEQEGELGDAEQCYRRAAQVENTAETNLRLAQFLQRTSRIAESEQVLRRVDVQRPTDPTALADFELIAGRPSNAADAYASALTSKSLRGASNAASLREERSRLATRIVEADVEVAAAKTGAEKTQAIKRAYDHLNSYQSMLDAATIAILQSEIALAEDNLPLATTKAAAAVSLAPKSPAALYNDGVVRMRSSDPEGARSRWLAALDGDSHFAPARLALTEQALAQGDAAGGESYVLPVVREEPGNFRALELFARVLIAEKRYESAMTLAQRAKALDPNSPMPHILMGEIAMAAHHEGESLIHFEQAILVDAHSTEALNGLTRLYKTGKITRPMLLKMEGVAAAPPASATLMEITGRLFADNHWYADAQRCLSAALRMDPQRTTAAGELAQAYAATGNLNAAADSAAKTGGNSAALLAGVQAQDRNDVNGAIDNYERAVRGGEKTGIAANNLAWLYAQQGRNLQHALDLAQTAQSLAPRDPAVLDTLGFVHLQMHAYTDAIKALESAKHIAIRNQAEPQLLAQIRQHLAEAYLRAGKGDEAAANERE